MNGGLVARGSGTVAEPGFIEDASEITQDLSYERVLTKLGVRREGGRLVRPVLVPSGTTREVDGKLKAVYFKSTRPVALDLKEAQANNLDWYDAARQTWVRGGLKAEKDHPDNLGSGPASHETVLVDLDEPGGQDAED